jgi:hypothetical protein
MSHTPRDHGNPRDQTNVLPRKALAAGSTEHHRGGDAFLNVLDAVVIHA